MPSNDTTTGPLAHVGSTAELGWRTCEHGCAGCDDCTDFDHDDAECDRCNGDGRVPWNDYLFPCPLCGGDTP